LASQILIPLHFSRILSLVEEVASLFNNNLQASGFFSQHRTLGEVALPEVEEVDLVVRIPSVEGVALAGMLQSIRIRVQEVSPHSLKHQVRLSEEQIQDSEALVELQLHQQVLEGTSSTKEEQTQISLETQDHLELRPPSNQTHFLEDSLRLPYQEDRHN
jgi:hypothetical protein